jgi:hypothetical protein
MSSSPPRKRTNCLLVLPDDLMHVVFSKLNTREKVIAAVVCKQWDQLLKVGGRHWDIDFNIDEVVSRTALPTNDEASSAHQPSVVIGRCGALFSCSGRSESLHRMLSSTSGYRPVCNSPIPEVTDPGDMHGTM